MRVGLFLILCVLPVYCSTRAEDDLVSRFRVAVEIEGNTGTYVATLKDAWGSYLAFEEGLGGDRAEFKQVPPGDFSLRVEFKGGEHLWHSLRVDPHQARSDGVVRVRLRAADAVTTTDTLESAYSVQAGELAVPDKAKKIFRKAWEEMERANWEGARKHLDKAVQIAPGYFDAWNNAGVAARKLNDLAGAEAYFRKAYLLRPDSFEVNINLSEVLGELNQLDVAIRHARRAQRLRPNDPMANAQLGMRLFHAKQFEECIPYLSLVAKVDPRSYYYPQILLAVAYEHLNQPFQALEQVEHWLKYHTSSPDRGKVEAKRQLLEQRVNAQQDVTAQ